MDKNYTPDKDETTTPPPSTDVGFDAKNLSPMHPILEEKQMKRGDKVMVSDYEDFEHDFNIVNLHADLGSDYEYRYAAVTNSNGQELTLWKYAKPHQPNKS